MATVTNRPLAVVTGASSGIGFELARQFATHGHDLLIVAEDAGIHDAARKLQNDGTAVHSVRSDLSARDGVDQVVGEIKSMARPVSVLAANAGVGVNGAFLDNDLDEELKMIQLNCTSAVQLTKRVLPDMVARKDGKLLFTSSIAATMPGPYITVYAATKAFLFSFAEGLRGELKDSGITVTALMPGATETNFFRRAGMEDTRVGAGKKDDPAEVAKQAFEALMAGKDKVFTASAMNRLQALANEILPETVKARLQRWMTEPGHGRKS